MDHRCGVGSGAAPRSGSSTFDSSSRLLRLDVVVDAAASQRSSWQRLLRVLLLAPLDVDVVQLWFACSALIGDERAAGVAACSC